MPTGLRCRRSFAAALLLLATACVDRHPLSPDRALPAPEPLASIQCQVTVATGRMSCGAPVNAGSSEGARTDRVLGGQNQYVKLVSSGTTYTSADSVLSSTITVQNLLQQAMGVDSSNTVLGVKVFFHAEPVVTSGEGGASVLNADSSETFTEGVQSYFLYNQALAPYEVSEGKLWKFKVDPTVVQFSFTLLISTPLADNLLPLRDAVWNGSVSTDWADSLNWSDSIAPDANSTVMIPAADSTITRMPVLSGNVAIANLFVATGGTLGLGGYMLEASGNVDADGTISSGTVKMTGAGGLLSGNVNALVLTAGTRLQGATKATGAVSVQGGPLNLNGSALSISVP